jgi:uncharacterized protein YndB with AHSA1/START domain
MAYVSKEREIDASPEAVWDALADWGALHTRLVPGFVLDTVVTGDDPHGDRRITFLNGVEVTERFIARDDDLRRLSWTAVEGPYTHHNGTGQVFPLADGRARFVWSVDILPEETAAQTDEMMEVGIEAAKRALDGAPAAT